MAFLRIFARNGLQYRNHLQGRVVATGSNASNLKFYCNEKLAIKEQKHDWNRAVSEAEKIVGFVLIQFYLRVIFLKITFVF